MQRWFRGSNFHHGGFCTRVQNFVPEHGLAEEGMTRMLRIVGAAYIVPAHKGTICSIPWRKQIKAVCSG